MVVTTKYDIGDEIYYIEADETKKGKVTDVKLTANLNHSVTIKYYINNNYGEWFHEEDLHSSLQELSDHLLIGHERQREFEERMEQ
jgi:hypothetical protein